MQVILWCENVLNVAIHGKSIINNQPACAAKCSAEFPSLSALFTSMPGKWRKSSRKFVKFVEQMYERAVCWKNDRNKLKWKQLLNDKCQPTNIEKYFCDLMKN
jgi:hypothetical protein